MSNKILIKTKEEIEIMAEGGKRLATILRQLSEKILTERVNGVILDEMAIDLTEKLDGTPAFKGYSGFPAALCVSVNDEVVHGIPNKTYFESGDLVKIDYGFWYQGLCTDAALTCQVGEISEEENKLIKVTQEALDRAIKECRPGKKIGDIGHTVQKYVEKNGFSVVRELVGHGVGKEVHEPPHIPNFGKRGTGVTLEEGMTLALEPMVNIGHFKVNFEDDGWTVKTADGMKSAHFEHTVAITSKGARILTTE